MENVDTNTRITPSAVDTTTATTIRTTTAACAENEIAGEEQDKNLEILEAYIRRQRTLLNRIRSDIERLQQRKQSVEDGPYHSLDRILRNDNHEEGQEKYTAEPERLGVLVEEVCRDSAVTKNINWKAFDGQNPGPLNILSRRLLVGTRIPLASIDLTTPSIPYAASVLGRGTGKTSLSAHVYLTPECRRNNATTNHSSLQAWVHAKRAELVRPVLESAARHLATYAPDSDDERMTGKIEKQQEEYSNEVMREPKDARARESYKLRGKAVNRRKGNASLGLAGTRSPQPRGSGGRFARRKTDEDKLRTPDRIDYGDEEGSEANRLSFSPAASASVCSTSVNRVQNVKMEHDHLSAADSRTCNGDVDMEIDGADASRRTTERLVITLRPLRSQGQNNIERHEPSSDSDSFSPYDHVASACTSITSNGVNSFALTTPLSLTPAVPNAKGVDDTNGSDPSVLASENEDGDENEKGENEANAAREKVRSTTFNQSWSDEEQRLLDLLLERFPDGTKNRWASISRAMGGHRTPRQVASRVQKYFAKMKKWGIDV